jgi:hypothetical protein
MAYATKTLEKILPRMIDEIPDVYFHSERDGSIEFQATDNDTARRIMRVFVGVNWVRKYDAKLGWWEWLGEWQGVTVRIYAIKETPKECKAIAETCIVTKKVPVEFEEQEVEETVIIGWDFGAGPE